MMMNDKPFNRDALYVYQYEEQRKYHTEFLISLTKPISENITEEISDVIVWNKDFFPPFL